MAPALCVGAPVAEFLDGFAGYDAVAAVWPNFYYTPNPAGKVTWLGLQGVCIAIYVVGVICSVRRHQTRLACADGARTQAVAGTAIVRH